jgi:hypothetical protein
LQKPFSAKRRLISFKSRGFSQIAMKFTDFDSFQSNALQVSLDVTADTDRALLREESLSSTTAPVAQGNAAKKSTPLPCVHRLARRIQIVGDVSTLTPAQAFLLAKDLAAAAFAATREELEGLKEHLRIHERELRLSTGNRAGIREDDPAAGED